MAPHAPIAPMPAWASQPAISEYETLLIISRRAVPLPATTSGRTSFIEDPARTNDAAFFGVRDHRVAVVRDGDDDRPRRAHVELALE